MIWNVYELKNTGRNMLNGRVLLCTVSGHNARTAAKDFARSYMTEHGVRCYIAKTA